MYLKRVYFIINEEDSSLWNNGSFKHDMINPNRINWHDTVHVFKGQFHVWAPSDQGKLSQNIVLYSPY